MTRTFVPDTTHVDAPTGSRYRKVLAKSLPFPHKCTGCGSIDRDCLDLDFQLADDRIQRGRIGAVLLCTQCYRNTADIMGYIPVELAELNVVAAVDSVMADDAQAKASVLGKLNKEILDDLRDKVAYYSDLCSNILAGTVSYPSAVETGVDLEPETSGRREPDEPLEVVEVDGPDEWGDPEARAKAIIFGNVLDRAERQASEPPVVEGSSSVPTVTKQYPKPESL